MPSVASLAVRFLRKKPVRSSTQTSLIASAAVPDSGFGFVHNLQGASAALDEFSGAVSAALEYIDLKDGFEGGPFKSQLRLLEDATADYSNSTTDACCELIDWNCDKSTAELVTVAFKCAAAVYQADPKVTDDAPNLTGLHRNPETAGIKFSELEYVFPSFGGSSKAIGFWIAESEVTQSANPDFPALVIAVRGTEKFIDHIVNANGRPIAAADFFGFSKHKFLDPFTNDLSAHSGFMRSAKRLAPLVSRHISELVQKNSIRHVIFSGHSAGGGVAALLYLKFLLDTDPLYESLKISCFTFGAPPVLSAEITQAIKTESFQKQTRGLNLAFVNEFDMVCRADQGYFRSLIDLFRSVYGLEPVMNKAIPRGPEEPGTPSTEDIPYVLPPLDIQDSDQRAAVSSPEDRPWPLPRAEYHVFGDMVLLRKEQDTRVESKERSRKEVRALSIQARDFEKLLYCGVKTHSRTHYDDRMESVSQGKFNYREGWEH